MSHLSAFLYFWFTWSWYSAPLFSLFTKSSDKIGPFLKPWCLHRQNQIADKREISTFETYLAKISQTISIEFRSRESSGQSMNNTEVTAKTRVSCEGSRCLSCFNRARHASKLLHCCCRLPLSNDSYMRFSIHTVCQKFVWSKIPSRKMVFLYIYSKPRKYVNYLHSWYTSIVCKCTRYKVSFPFYTHLPLKILIFVRENKQWWRLFNDDMHYFIFFVQFVRYTALNWVFLLMHPRKLWRLFSQFCVYF